MGIDIDAAYRGYGPMVIRRCRALLRDEEEAMDCAHDVFVKLTRHRDKLDARAMCSLLYTMATREALNRIRSRRISAGDDEIARIASLDDHAGASDVRSMLSRIFADEQPSTRVIAVLHHVDGMTYEEVASVVGLSVSGVRKRLRALTSRARALVPEGT